MNKMLTTLPNEMIINLFKFIKLITDKRQFAKTCHKFNFITKNLINKSEEDFLLSHKNDMIEHGITRILQEPCYYSDFKINEYCVEKFTLELCNDLYFGLIPKSYLNVNNKILMAALASHGQIDLLKIAINNGCLIVDIMSAHAARCGHLDVIELIHNNGIGIGGTVSDSAALYGHLNIIKYLWGISARDKNGVTTHNWFTTQTCEVAAVNGHLHIIKWIMKTDINMIESIQKIFEVAAAYGHLNIIIWGHSNASKDALQDDKNVIVYNFGNLNIHKTIEKSHEFSLYYSNQSIWDEEQIDVDKIFETAAMFGHLNIIIWGYNNGFVFNKDIFEVASYYRHLHIILWAYNNKLISEDDYEFLISEDD